MRVICVCNAMNKIPEEDVMINISDGALPNAVEVVAELAKCGVLK